MMKIMMILMMMMMLIVDDDNENKDDDDIVGIGMPGAGWPNTPPHFRSYEGEPPFLIC